MENKPIFLSMAAIDGKKAEQNQWLPKELFPLRTHRIAAAGWSHDGNEFAGGNGKGDISQCCSFTFQCMVSIIDILKF